MFDFKFLQDRYDFEFARKEQLTSALTMPIGVVSGVGGLLAAMVKSFSFPDSMLWWFFVIPMVADALSLVVCLWFLAKAYHMQTYVYLPLLKDLDEVRDEFSEFNRYVEATGGTVEETFAGDLRRRIIDAADANTTTNEKRSEILRVARLWLFAVLWLTAFTSVPYIADRVRF